MNASAAASVSAGVAAIELCGVVKDFAVGWRGVKVRAVDALTLRVEPGRVYGLLGPNGSGKSTTIKLVLGLLAPTTGTCAIFGVSSERVESRREVGYAPESPAFHRYLTGRELVRFAGKLCGMRGGALERRASDVLASVGLTDAADRKLGLYSKGMLQRAGVAQALVHDPRLLILDEPTSGIDPAGAAEMSELILKLKAQGRTVLVTSHLLGHIENVCDRVAILDRGRLALEGTLNELLGRAERQSLVVESLSPAQLEELRSWLAARGRALEAVETPRSRLEQLYLECAKQKEAP